MAAKIIAELQERLALVRAERAESQGETAILDTEISELNSRIMQLEVATERIQPIETSWSA